jgi:hypothetical protein
MSQAAHYSPSEFRFGFLPEETIGTALVPASGKNLQLINVDNISAPSLNTEIVSDVRSGAGRTAKTADLYVNSTLMKREISFSGTADYNSLPELLSAVMGVAEDADNFKILVSHTPLFDMKTDVQRTDDGTAATYSSAWAAALAINAGTHTVYIWSPVSNKSMQFKGCVLQSLTISSDMGTESGRFKVEGSWVTGYDADLTVAAPNSSFVTAYSSNNYYLTDIDTHTIAGVSDPVIQSFSMTIENPTEYLGFVGTSEVKPEIISRAVPEISANWESTFKYDTDSAGLFETYEAGTNVALTTSDSTNAKIGFTSAKNVITSVGFAENAAQYVTVGAKVMSGASGSMLEVIAKDA